MCLNNRSKILWVTLIVICVFLGIAIVFMCLSNVSKPIEKYKEKIKIQCIISEQVDIGLINNVTDYSLDGEKFYRYDDAESEMFFETPYSIRNYIPYKITVIIKNDSEIEFSGKHLNGIYSNECVFTEVSDISYWTGSIPAYSEKKYEMIIWFSKNLSENQISQYISELDCSYQLLGNFSYFKNTVVEKVITIYCEFLEAENT